MHVDVSHFSPEIKLRIQEASPVPITDRLKEVESFIYFNANIGTAIKNPGFARAYTAGRSKAALIIEALDFIKSITIWKT